MRIESTTVDLSYRADNRSMYGSAGKAEELKAATQVVNDSGVLGAQYELAFGQDQRSGRPLVRLLDRNTHEVVRQVPAEYVLRMARQGRSQAT